MAHVIAEPCIGTMAAECVQACPVDAIHPRPTEANFSVVQQLFIDPESCIDCVACVNVCPVAAIFSQAGVPEIWHEYIAKNAQYYSG